MNLPRISLLLPMLGIALAVNPVAAQQNIYAPSRTAQLDAASVLEALPKDRVVSYKTIAGDFAKDETAASGKYGNRRFTVIGRISSLNNGNSENKALVVTMQDAAANLPAVKCNFLADAIPPNSSIEVSSDGSQVSLVRRDESGNIRGRDVYLSVGQKVAIKGDFKELKVGDIVLTACKLDSHAKLKELEAGH